MLILHGAFGLESNLSKTFHDRLSEYNIFIDPKNQHPTDRFVPYELNTPHFADYATLHRFLSIPRREKIDVSETGSLHYPEGSTLVLTVGYPKDMRDLGKGEEILETRLMIKGVTGWQSAQYVWNKETTEAYLTLVGQDIPVEWIDGQGEIRHHKHHVPNINQCKMCHEVEDRFVPLGPMDARNLNSTLTIEGESINQLDHWRELGWLSGPTDDLPVLATWDEPETGSLDQRARAYLHINCSSCHQPGGLAYTSGLDLTYDQIDPVRFGIFKTPVAAGRGVGEARFGIVPGQPESSILFHRLGSTDPGVRMPVVGRSLVHEEGLELIARWIESMDYPRLMKEHEEMETSRAKRFAGLPETP